MQFSERSIRGLKPGDYWDRQVTGLGLRVGEKGSKWRLKVPVAKDGGGWRHKVVILGAVDQFENLADVRRKAEIQRGEILKRHGDPDRVKREVEAGTVTLRTAWGRYIERCRDKGRSAHTLSNYEDARNRFGAYVVKRKGETVYRFADWLDRPLAAIGADREGVVDRFDKLSKHCGKVVANRAFQAFRAMYAHPLRPIRNFACSQRRISELRSPTDKRRHSPLAHR